MSTRLRGITVSERRTMVDDEPRFPVQAPGAPQEWLRVNSHIWGKVRWLGGGEGYVFRVARESDGRALLLKLFKDDVIEREPNARWERTRWLCEQGLSSSSPPDASSAFRGAPVLLVVDNFGFLGDPLVGLLMELAQGREWKYLKRDATVRMDRDVRIGLCRQLAVGCRFLEQKGLAHCDLSDTNVLVDLANRTLSIVDYDLFWSNGAQPLGIHMAAPGPGRPGYFAPPGTNRAGSLYDRFALAILIWELLVWEEWGRDDDELHIITQDSIDARRPTDLTKLRNLYRPDVAQRIEDALLADSPEARPSPEDWIEVLDGLVERPVRSVVVHKNASHGVTTDVQVCHDAQQLARLDSLILVEWRWDSSGFHAKLRNPTHRSRCSLRDPRGDLVPLKADEWRSVQAGSTLKGPLSFLQFEG